MYDRDVFVSFSYYRYNSILRWRYSIVSKPTRLRRRLSASLSSPPNLTISHSPDPIRESVEEGGGT